eukprot:1501814-Prymnesium_polylepis.1
MSPLAIWRELHAHDEAALQSAAVTTDEQALALPEVRDLVQARAVEAMHEATVLLDAIVHPSAVERL